MVGEESERMVLHYGNRGVMERTGLTIRSILPAALLLLPLIFWPAGPDQSIYLAAGKILAEGGVYYRDVADVKPPLIGLLFGGANGLLGEGIFWVRLIEYLLQLLILLLIVRTLRYVGEGRGTIMVATILYALLYASLGPDGTPQPESFVGLLLLPMMLFQMRRRKSAGSLLVGVLGGLLFTLKFSFAAVLGGAILAEFLVFSESNREALRRSLLILLGGGSVILLFFLLLALFDLLSGWELMSGWIRGRLLFSLRNQNPVSLILRETGFYLGYGFSLAMLVGLFRAISQTFSLVDTDSRPEKDNASILQWRRLSILMFLALLASAITELMFVPYQFSRIFVPAAMLVAPVVVDLWERRGELFRGKYGRVMFPLLLLTGLVFSPLPKYLSEMWRGVTWRVASGNGLEASFDRSADTRWREVEELCDTIRSRSSLNQEGEKLFVVSDIASFFYAELHQTPRFGILHGHYLIASFTPESLQQEFMSYLRREKPEFLILERNDGGAAGIVGVASTMQGLERIEGFSQILEEKYRKIVQTAGFDLYQRESW